MPDKDAQPEPLEETPPFCFRAKGRSGDDEVDMTPMVDITFLLLIFFMVTAAFSLQKSIKVPAPKQQDESARMQSLQDIETNEDYVIVEIRRDNSIFVNDVEVGQSEHELLVRLRKEREDSSDGDSRWPTSLLVLADRECRHETVVMALDAGNAVGMERVRLATADEEDF